MRFDTLIVNGTVVDGTGAPGFQADIAVRGRKIAAVSKTGRFYASRRSKVFHPEGCEHLANIQSQNLVEFVSRDEALSSGRRAGRGCQMVVPNKTEVPRPVQHAASRTGRYVSEAGTPQYHPEGCFHVKGKTDLTIFTDADEADLSGRTPARDCRIP